MTYSLTPFDKLTEKASKSSRIQKTTYTHRRLALTAVIIVKTFDVPLASTHSPSFILHYT